MPLGRYQRIAVGERGFTDSEKAKIVELVKPFSPTAMRWYLPSGIDNLV